MQTLTPDEKPHKYMVEVKYVFPVSWYPYHDSRHHLIMDILSEARKIKPSMYADDVLVSVDAKRM